MTDDEVRAFTEIPLDLHVRAHTVKTERTIRDTTRVAGKTTSSKKRDGMMRSIFADRSKKPRLEKKSDFVA
jgi:hypothetical protein